MANLAVESRADHPGLFDMMTATNESGMSNIEPRMEALEISAADLRRDISDLRSTIATLADIVAANETRLERSIAQAEIDRATLYRTFEDMRAEARLDRERIDQLRADSDRRFAAMVEQANQDRQRTDHRLTEAAERANQDRALMLQLIQAMQERNGN